MNVIDDCSSALLWENTSRNECVFIDIGHAPALALTMLLQPSSPVDFDSPLFIDVRSPQSLVMADREV